MDSIRQYLDGLFARLPLNERTQRARAELEALMEDKYNELRASGRSENEAIGQVISEFGNIDELAEALEVEAHRDTLAAAAASEPHDGQRRRRASEQLEHLYLSANEVDQYRSDVRRASPLVALGVLLCILSPAVLIVAGGYAREAQREGPLLLLGLGCLFLFIVAAIPLFVLASSRFSPWEKLEHKVIDLDQATRRGLMEARDAQRGGFALRVSVGVGLIIIGVFVLIGVALLIEEDIPVLYATSGLLAFVALGVALLIHNGLNYEVFSRLLNEGDYSAEAMARNRYFAPIAAPYWLLVTAAYLLWSFLGKSWHISWIIWPIAGIVFGAIAVFVSAINARRR